jgi:ribosome-binding factor A
LEDVRVNSVDVSGDLSVAKVYFSLLQPDADARPAVQALDKAAGFLRSKLGRELTLRHVPELRFLHDQSVKRGLELTRLIEEAGGGPPARKPPTR